MTISPLRTLYVDACKMKRIAPSEPEFREWKSAFADCELRDVQAGLSAHWQDTREDSEGRKRGSFFPSVADLKPLVYRAKAKRERELATPQDFLAFRCPKCGVGCSCFVARGENREPPRCERCKISMVQVHRSEPELERADYPRPDKERDAALIKSLMRKTA